MNLTCPFLRKLVTETGAKYEGRKPTSTAGLLAILLAHFLPELEPAEVMRIIELRLTPKPVDVPEVGRVLTSQLVATSSGHPHPIRQPTGTRHPTGNFWHAAPNRPDSGH